MDQGILLQHFFEEAVITFEAMQQQGSPSWTMSYALVKAVSENNREEFRSLVLQQLERSGEFVLNVGQPPTTTESTNDVLQGVTSDEDGVLHIAARFGDDMLVRHILEKLGIVLPASNAIDDSETPASNAIDDSETPASNASAGTTGVQGGGSITAAYRLLRATNRSHETCLHEAVRHGHAQVVESLLMADTMLHQYLQQQASSSTAAAGLPLVRMVDSDGISPLYLATALHRLDIVRMLAPDPGSMEKLRYYTAASYVGPRGQTALHAAVLLSKELSEQLHSWNKDLTGVQDDSQSTPLHFLASWGGTTVAEVLLPDRRKQENTNAPDDGHPQADDDTMYTKQMTEDSSGFRPIHVAAAHGNLDVVQRLCQVCPADCIPSRNHSGQTFLHVAVQNTRLNVVHYVCNDKRFAGILNTRDKDGNTALHLAVKTGNQRIFCSLMSNRGVYLNIANKEGRTPLDLAELSIQPGLTLLLSSRILLYCHLRLVGADFGARRRDDLVAEMAEAQPDDMKEKLSETMTKTAGVIAVCAIFMLNIAVTALFNVAKPETNDGHSSTSSGRSGSSSSAVALVVSDAVAFTASILSAFCSTFAGLSIIDRRTRLAYLRVAVLSLLMASLAVVAIFVLVTYRAFALVYPHVYALLSASLALVAIAPQIAPIFLVLLHIRALLYRLGLRRLCSHVGSAILGLGSAILGLIILALIPAIVAVFGYVLFLKFTHLHQYS